MTVQFILGRSGTGKTSYCVRAIADALQEPSEQPLLFLVPEQATYQAERAILSEAKVPGYHRLHVLSFQRLLRRLLHKPAIKPDYLGIGRQLVVHKILRASEDELQAYGLSALLPGFCREMAATVNELCRYANGPDDIDALVGRLKGGNGGRLSALKFADIGLVFRRYTESSFAKALDADTQVAAARRAIVESDFTRGATLWVDGFASFTGGEMALLIKLLQVVQNAYVALCTDPDEAVAGEKAGLFEPTVQTYRQMLEGLEEAGVRVVRPVALVGTPRFDDSPALAHVERNLFRPGAKKAKAAGDIRLVAAPSPRMEIRHVAQQILSLVRDQGYRYRDIAVVASDLGHYEQYVRAYFEDDGIPFFIDRRKPLSQHPVVELTSAALHAVTGGLTRADVFAWLKTDLISSRRSDIAALENYCLAFGVEGRDWASSESWRFKPTDSQEFDEDQVNRIRQEVVTPLLDLREALCPDGDLEHRLTVEEFTHALFAFLDRLQIRRTVARWIEEAQENDGSAAADEHRQFFDVFVDMFDTLTEIFDREEMTAQDYSGLLASAFSQMTLAFIPPRLDQVLVGSIERSRHPSLKAVFLLGATQRQFPVPITASGVLSDEDRDAAEAAGFAIAPSSARSLIDRQYLAYIAFTRPSKFMHISYPCSDEKGSPIMRSHFVDELQSLFEDLGEEFMEDKLPTLDDVQNRSELAELLCSRLGRDASLLVADDKEILAGLLRAMPSDPECGGVAERVLAALRYRNQASLEQGVARELFGRSVPGSATRLGTYAACPYKHFARYILDLKPRPEFKIEPLDLGLFYHRTLDSLHKRLAAENEDFGRIDPDRLVRLLHEEIERLAEKGTLLWQFARRSAHNAFIIDNAGRMLEECVLAIARMVRAGSFRPYRSELGFGRAPDASETLGRFELSLPGGQVLSFDGKIDRLDLAESDGRKVALIVDYKRTISGAKFDWCKFYHGLDMQLAIYMLAVQHDSGLAQDIAGALLMPIETTPRSATLTELEEDKPPKFPYKARGIINGAYCHLLDANASGYSDYYSFYVKKDGDPCGMYAKSNAMTAEHFAKLLDWARRGIIRLAADLASGRIECRPYHRGTERACARCEYMGVCRFDWQINDYNFLRSVSKTDLVGELDTS